jgi:hypothetical protein
MTASSIAQYLEQRRTTPRPAERGDPRKEAWAALAGRAATQGDGEPQSFRPLPFKPAPSAARVANPYAEPATASLEAPAGRRGSALFRPREPASAPTPPPDIEERLSEAYHRGVQEGLDAARAEAATARAMERAEIQKRVVVERLDFQMNEYAKLSDAIGLGLKDVERRISESVERILRPFLLAAVTSRAVDEVAASIARLASTGHRPLMKVSGPEPLLKLLKDRLGAIAVEFEFAPDSQIEIKVEATHTTIATELGPWADWLESLSGPAD